jgi:NADH-quinone oxidoreductase subunit J
MDLELIGWYVMAGIAVVCAVGMVGSKNPVHSALWLVGNFVSLAVVYLILSAPMLFAIQMIVYAGAIMVLFLFVVMFFMAPSARTWLRPPLKGQLVIGGLLAIMLLVLVYMGFGKGGIDPQFNFAEKRESTVSQLTEQMGQPRELGRWLFNYHALPFELTSLLLLAALLGAVMLARDESSEGREEFVEFAPTVHEAGEEGVAK